MTEKHNSLSCHVMCWIVAGLAAIVAMFMLYLLADFGYMQAFFGGAVIGALLGVFSSIFVCSGNSAAQDLASNEKSAQRYAAKAEAEKNQRANFVAPTADAGAADAPAANAPEAPAAAAASSAAATTTTAAPLMSGGLKPSAPLAGEAELASRKGSWKYEGESEAKKPAKKPAAKKPAAKKPAAKKAAAAKAPAKAEAKRAPVAADGQPMIYDAPPSDGADDLKLISGVGPKLEQTLNDMGIYRFEQVAGWRKKEIAWVDDRLRFKGRIERDDWMSQAKILAKGGETEFSKRSKK